MEKAVSDYNRFFSGDTLFFKAFEQTFGVKAKAADYVDVDELFSQTKDYYLNKLKGNRIAKLYGKPFPMKIREYLFLLQLYW